MASPREADESSQSVQGVSRAEEELAKAGMHITGLGDAGEMLDEQAKVAYRRRLSELRAEVEEAKALGHVERAEHAEEEMEALTRELARAVGLGGRNRRAASAAERARQSITKAIKSALDTIAQSDATLGALLSRCIKTGTFCAYQPAPDFPLAWEFTKPTEPAEPPMASSDPVVLAVSLFALAERTAFVGRDSECGAMRTLLERA